MKRLTTFLTIFLIMGLGIITVFSIKPQARINYDYTYIGDTNYISINHDFLTQTTYTRTDEYGSYFLIQKGDTTNFYGLPYDWQSMYRNGYIFLYFRTDIPIEKFLGLELTVKNNGGFSNTYIPFNFDIIDVYSGVYWLSASWDEIGYEGNYIGSNYWNYDIRINTETVGSQSYFTILENNGVNNPSHFSFVYSNNFANLTEYEEGYRDGYRDGELDAFDKGYDKGYDEGNEIGRENGISIGKDIGYGEGYDKGINDATDNSFYGIIGQVFMGIGNFLSIELLPNITFGAILSVPLVFGIISFIIGKRGGKDD